MKNPYTTSQTCRNCGAPILRVNDPPMDVCESCAAGHRNYSEAPASGLYDQPQTPIPPAQPWPGARPRAASPAATPVNTPAGKQREGGSGSSPFPSPEG